MRKHVWLYCFALLVVVALLVGFFALPAGTVQALAGDSMFRWLAGNGSGGGTASGGGYTLSDSLGQSLIGPSTAGSYRLEAGYQVGLQNPPAGLVYLPIVYRTNP